MKEYRIMVCKYGFATVEANSESEALKKVNTMTDSDFDWSKDYSDDDAEIIDNMEE